MAVAPESDGNFHRSGKDPDPFVSFVSFVVPHLFPLPVAQCGGPPLLLYAAA